VQGDTIPKITITSSDFPDLTTSTIKMQVYNGKHRFIDISDSSGITVLSATSCEIDEVPAVSNNYPDGVHYGDFQVEDSIGNRITYFRVRYTIQKQYTV